MMRSLLGVLVAGSLSLAACSYAPGGVSADGHTVIAKNDGFLFGLLSKIFVCQVTPEGVKGCVAGEAP